MHPKTCAFGAADTLTLHKEVNLKIYTATANHMAGHLEAAVCRGLHQTKGQGWG